MRTSAILHGLLAALILASATLAAPPPRPATGRVVDEKGQAIVGARACTNREGSADLCEQTDVSGRYQLPSGENALVRINAKGYLPRTVPAAPQDQPIVLARAAALHARLVDGSTGESVGDGELMLFYEAGKKKLGPFPVNSKGLSIATLPPGDVEPVASAGGYEVAHAPVLKLRAGEPSDVVIKLTKKKATSPGR